MPSISAESLQALDFVRSRIEILDCVNKYARGMDRLDPEMTNAAFHADAVLDYGVFVGNPAEFVAYFYDLHRRYHLSTNHMICNHVCELAGERAYAETYFAVANNNREGPAFGLGGGRYVDQFERRDGRWAISVRKCVAEWDATPGLDLVEKLNAIFTQVGHVSRDRDDVSYQRPSVIAAERLGTLIPV
jgi:hypothetical protein